MPDDTDTERRTERPPQVAALLAAFPVVVDLPVAWGEMDAMCHVNGVVFIRYFETCRFTYFARLGPPLEGMGRSERGWILASLTCRYRAPLTFPDTVSVGTRIKAVGDDRFVMEHRVVSHALSTVAAEGEVLIVAYDYRTAGKTALTEADRASILTIEGREPPAMERPATDAPPQNERRPMFKRIDHVEIIPSDIEEAIAFYTGVLGFAVKDRVVLDLPPLRQVVYLTLGDTMLELLDYESPAPDTSGGPVIGYRMMALEVESMATALAYLADMGVSPSREPYAAKGTTTSIRAEITDPDGLPIELRQWS